MEPALEALFDDATGDLALGALEEAAEKYKQCAETAPDYFEAWHALGMVNMKLGRFAEAIEAARWLATAAHHSAVMSVGP